MHRWRFFSSAICQRLLGKVNRQCPLAYTGPLSRFEFHNGTDIDRWTLHLSRVFLKELVLNIWNGGHCDTPSLILVRGYDPFGAARVFFEGPVFSKDSGKLKNLDTQNSFLTQNALEALIFSFRAMCKR